MKTPILKWGLASACIIGLLGTAATAAAINSSVGVQSSQAAENMQAGLPIRVKAGEVLEFTLLTRRHGWDARQARRDFNKRVRPFAENVGQDYLGDLKIDDVVIGKSKPSAIEISSYPSVAHKRAINNSRAWDDIQTHRRLGWKKSVHYATVLTSDLDVYFDPDKHYTLAIAWTNPARSEEYDRYLDGMEAEFERVGARFVHKFRDIQADSANTKSTVPPYQITIVEWDKATGLSDLISSPAYQAHRPFFQSGVSGFQLFKLG